MEALELRDHERLAEVNAAQMSGSTATSSNRSKKAPPRQGLPAPSNSSAESSSSRAPLTGRTVRFQDQVGGESSNHGYGSSGRSRRPGNQSPQGHRWIVVRQGKGPLATSPHRLDGYHVRVVRVVHRQSGGPWMPGQGGPRSRLPAQGNAGNWRPGWPSPSGDRGGQSPVQQQYSPGQRRWSQNAAYQQPPATADMPPPRGCHVYGHLGCHTMFHGPNAVSP